MKGFNILKTLIALPGAPIGYPFAPKKKIIPFGYSSLASNLPA